MVFRTAKALGAFAVGGRATIDILCNRGRTHKAYRLNGLVVQDRVHSFFVTVDDLKHTFRQASFRDQLGQTQRCRRAALGRFQDHGVARYQCRGHFPKRDHCREVEWRNTRHNAQRLAHRVKVDTRTTVVHVLALQHVGCAHANLDHFQTTLNVATRVRQGFTVLAADQLGQLVHVFVDQVSEFHHHARATLRVGGSPRNLCFGGFLDDRIHLSFGGQRHFRLNFAGGGVKDVGKAARGSGDMCAVHIVGQFGHGTLLYSVHSLTLRKTVKKRQYPK